MRLGREPLAEDAEQDEQADEEDATPRRRCVSAVRSIGRRVGLRDRAPLLLPAADRPGSSRVPTSSWSRPLRSCTAG